MLEMDCCRVDCADLAWKCAANSTHHGVNHAGHAKRRLHKFFWLTIVICAYVCFFYHLSTLIVRYLSYPVSTNIEYKRVPFRFPDVTICNLMPFSLRLIELKFGNLNLLNTIEREGFADLVEQGKLPKEDFFVDCKFDEEKCDWERIEVIDDPTYKHCYRILADPTIKLKTKLPESGLNLLLFIGAQHRHSLIRLNTSATFVTSLEAAGIKVVVHEPGTHPHPGSHGFEISTGVSAKVALMQERVELLGDTGSIKCEWETKSITYCNLHSGVRSTYVKTQEDCFAEKVQAYLFHECGCVTDFYDVPESYCFAGAADCALLDEQNASFACARDKLNAISAIFDEITAECLVPCTTENWNGQLSITDWPNYIVEEHVMNFVKTAYHTSLSKNNQTALDELATATAEQINQYDLIKKNLVQLFVYPASLSGNRIFEVAAYPFSSFLGETGGIIGLWLGCSVLTFFEPLSVILAVIYRLLSRSNLEKHGTSSRTHDYEVVEINQADQERTDTQ